MRAAIQEGTPIGLQAKSYMDAGKLVPDEVIIGIIRSVSLSPTARQRLHPGWGAPYHRSGRGPGLQPGVPFDRVLSLEITDQEIEERMTGRRVCSTCGATYHIHAKPPKAEGVCDNCGGVPGPAR